VGRRRGKGWKTPQKGWTDLTCKLESAFAARKEEMSREKKDNGKGKEGSDWRRKMCLPKGSRVLLGGRGKKPKGKRAKLHDRGEPR